MREKRSTTLFYHFQLRTGFQVTSILLNVICQEEKNHKAYATLLEWKKIFFLRTETSVIRTRKTQIFVLALFQWQMREVASCGRVVDTVNIY